jgi:hypothetical protein
MAQTIKIKRGGIGRIATTAAATLAPVKGELFLGTGSFNNLAGPLLLAATADNSLSPAYARVDTFTGNQGPALATAITNGDANFTGLFIHSGSKFYRHNGSTGFDVLNVSAGSFDGTLGVTNGGTGLSTIADNSILVSTAANTLSAVSLSTNGGILVGGTTVGPAVVAPSTLAGAGLTATAGDGTLVLQVVGAANGHITVNADDIAVNTTTLRNAISSSLYTYITGDVTISAAGVASVNSIDGVIATDGANRLLTSDGDGTVTAEVNVTYDGSTFIVNDDVNLGNNSAHTITIGNNAGATVNIGNASMTTNVVGGLSVAGNLTVAGTTTTVNSTTVNIGDRIIQLNYSNAAGDAGIIVNDTSTAQTGSLLWDTTGNYWKVGLATNNTGGGTLYRLPEQAANTALTENALVNVDGSGRLEASAKFTDNGTNGSIADPLFTGLNAASTLDTDRVVFVTAGGEVGQVVATQETTVVTTGLLGYDGTGLTFSSLIDGGTF